MNYSHALTLLALLLLSVAQSIQSCATMWDHKNYEGYSLAIQSGQVANMDEHCCNWNDRISSVKVKTGCTLELFENDRYRGRIVTLVGPKYVPRLSVDSYNFNDRASSYKCDC